MTEQLQLVENNNNNIKNNKIEFPKFEDKGDNEGRKKVREFSVFNGLTKEAQLRGPNLMEYLMVCRRREGIVKKKKGEKYVNFLDERIMVFSYAHGNQART